MKIILMLLLVMLLLSDIYFFTSLTKYINKHKYDLIEEHWKYIKSRLIAIFIISGAILILCVILNLTA